MVMNATPHGPSLQTTHAANLKNAAFGRPLVMESTEATNPEREKGPFLTTM